VLSGKGSINMVGSNMNKLNYQSIDQYRLEVAGDGNANGLWVLQGLYEQS